MTQFGPVSVDDHALDAICIRHHVRTLYLFGSAARQTMRPDSDLDVMVAFDSTVPISLFDVGALQMDLTDLLGRRVDVATESGIRRTRWYAQAVRERRRVYGG